MEDDQVTLVQLPAATVLKARLGIEFRESDFSHCSEPIPGYQMNV